MFLQICYSIMIINLFGVSCFRMTRTEPELCDKRDSCRFNEDVELAICYCDAECIIFNDCCKEYITSNNLTKTLNGSTLYSCVNVMTGSRNGLVKVGSFIIDRCKESGSTCNVTFGDLETMVPVSKGRLTFRNSHCATCNGVDDFTYWSISYEIPKYKELNQDSLDFQSLVSEEALFDLEKDVFLNEEYYLYPPDGFNPRYCPYDIFNDGEKDRTELQHQNFVSCENTLYKNRDICLKNKFCNLSEIECFSYDTSYTTSRNLTLQRITASIPKSLQILIRLKSKKDGDLSLGEGDGELSLKYIRKRIEIYIELRLIKRNVVKDSKQLIETCILVVIDYLKATKYVLMVDAHRYPIETNDGVRYTAHLVFRSMTELSVSDLKDLINIHLNLQYLKPTGETFLVGSLQRAHRNVTYRDHFAKTYGASIGTSDMSLVPPPFTIMNCRNVTFILRPKMSEYDVDCVDNAVQSVGKIIWMDVNCLKITSISLSFYYAHFRFR